MFQLEKNHILFIFNIHSDEWFFYICFYYPHIDNSKTKALCLTFHIVLSFFFPHFRCFQSRMIFPCGESRGIYFRIAKSDVYADEPLNDSSSRRASESNSSCNVTFYLYDIPTNLECVISVRICANILKEEQL